MFFGFIGWCLVVDIFSCDCRGEMPLAQLPTLAYWRSLRNSSLLSDLVEALFGRLFMLAITCSMSARVIVLRSIGPIMRSKMGKWAAYLDIRSTVSPRALRGSRNCRLFSPLVNCFML